jgi:hypothetical protein
MPLRSAALAVRFRKWMTVERQLNEGGYPLLLFLPEWNGGIRSIFEVIDGLEADLRWLCAG